MTATALNISAGVARGRLQVEGDRALVMQVVMLVGSVRKNHTSTTDSKRESSVGVHGHVHQAVPSIAVCDTGGIGVTMWPGRARRPGAQ